MRYHDDFEAGCYYHVYNRSINNEKIYYSERNFNFFIEKFNQYLIPYVNIITYCLMPTHFHFFIEIKEMQVNDINVLLSDQFKRFFSCYALSFNSEYKRHGSLFQKRFKRIKVNDESYFTTLIHYIHNNPIHHRVASTYSEWKYSSYNAIISDKPTKILRELVLNWFGGKEQFILFHNRNIKYDKISKMLVD